MVAMASSSWPRVVVLGAGAVGCYFGGMLARAGAPVTLIARPQHVDAIGRDGLLLDTLHFSERVRVAATMDESVVREADIVLVSVKTPDTEAAGRTLAPHLAADAVVVSLQNGIENAPQLRAQLTQLVVPSVVYVAAEMVGAGHVKHRGRGDLVVGRQGGTVEDQARVDALAAMFARAGVPCRVSPQIDIDLWQKLMTNAAFNGLSALTRMQYGPIIEAAPARMVLELLVREVGAVARGSGVALQDEELIAAAYRLAEAMPGATSSTAQDLARGRRTEIDELNGFIVRRGEEVGVPTPVNRTVHALVKLLETPSGPPR